jgi:hypothetical protein
VPGALSRHYDCFVAVGIMSRVRTRILGWAAAAACALPALAQYPGRVTTDQPENTTHLRATAVLEFTGDLGDIKASRLVPIAIWDGVQYQPGGLYLAQPAPLAVLAGTQYELESDGKSQGFFNVKDAEDLSGLWIGVGSFQAPPAAPRKAAAKDSGHAYFVKDADPDKPHFAHRPVEDNSQNNGSGAQSSGQANGPTLHPRPSDGSSGDNSGSNTTAAQPEVDPDRPTFHNRVTNNHTASNQMAVDPDRPRLSYTTPESQQKLEKPDALFGLPPDMKQMAGISDSNPAGMQTFNYSWATPDDAAKMQAALEAVAQKAVAPPAPPAPKTAAAHTTRHKSAAPAPPPLPELADEEFRVYGLTFGGGATMVLSAHTTTTPEKYVTVIAQPDFYGNVQVLLKQVSDADSLDATPRMRLIDAVDTEGNGRGDLIFELRGQTYREFAIYRVYEGQATQVFATQPTSSN